jgi:hypothetical protein
MKNTFRLLAALLPIITFSGASAQTVNPLFNHIPAKADQVIHIDLKTIGPKIDWSTMASLLNGRNIGKNKLPFDIMSLMNSGCDFRGDLVIVRTNVNYEDSVKYTTVVVHVTDSAKFVSFLRSTFHEINFQHLPGHERVAVDDKHTAYAWSDKIAIIQIAKRPVNDDRNLPSDQYLARKAVSALHGSVGGYFTTDARFLNTFSNDGDMHIWNLHAGNMGALTKMVQGMPNAAPMNGLAQLAAKTTTGSAFGTLRFEPGKITYHSIRVLSPNELTNLQHLAGQGLDNHLVGAAPPGKPIGLAGMHYNIAAIVDSLAKNIPADSLKSMLAKKGFDLQDFRRALKGDILFLAYAPEKNPDGTTSKKPGFYLMLSVDDPSAFTRVANGLKLGDANTFASSQAVDSTHHGMLSWYAVHDGVAYLGGNPLAISAIPEPASGSGSPVSHLLLRRSRPDIFYLGIDMHTTADVLTIVLTKADTIAANNKALLDALRQMDVLLVSSGGTKDGAMESDLELRMTDKDKNGLSSLIDIVGKLSPKKSGNAQQ